MPQVCRHIRQSYSRVELPIIMLSPEHPTEEDTQAALQAGVNDFLVKPLRQGLLLARLSAHILLPKLVASEVDRQHNYALLETMLPPRCVRVVCRDMQASQRIDRVCERVSNLLCGGPRAG